MRQPSRRMERSAARDSLSPRRVYSYVEKYGEQVDSVLGETGDEVDLGAQEGAVDDSCSSRCNEVAGSNLTSKTACYDMTTIPAQAMADATCSPRYALSRRHRPFDLQLDESRGATSVSSSELRHLIKQTAAFGATYLSFRVQVIDHTSLPTPLPVKGRRRYPGAHAASVGVSTTAAPAPAIPERSQHRQYARPMGNQQSHNGGMQRPVHLPSSSTEDLSTSTDSMLHNPRFRPREPLKRPPVAVLKKKVISKPQNITTTVIEVPRAATAPNLDLIDDEQAWEDEHVDHKQVEAGHKKTLSAPSPALASRPDSPATMTEELASRPLSAGTTVTGISIRSGGELSPARLRVSALSPTIPSPSPLPEDSPHQYGLKDFTNTPTPPQDKRQAKRRSTGADIFYASEAKNLQSAASFLNGLSNARRRAESRAQDRSTSRLDDTTNIELNRGHASYHDGEEQFERSQERPLTPKLDDLSRTLGHTHKSSGFAYSKPLSLMQLQCYRKHERLTRSGNKLYQVECAICHKDEPQDYYWSCSWCAVRMCDECRYAFRIEGMKALKDRIRDAELGAQ